jgi:hypothetical protein
MATLSSSLFPGEWIRVIPSLSNASAQTLCMTLLLGGTMQEPFKTEGLILAIIENIF